MAFETWLTEEDVNRLYLVAVGELPEIQATTDELEEFAKVVLHTAMVKMAGDGYDTATLH
jgi:hypothetical protein